MFEKLPSSFEALAGLEILSRQPCNNFKVVAHTSQNYVNDVKIGTNGTNLKQKTTTGSNVPVGNQTRLLTVWRTLYVERDSMAAPVYTQGPAPSRIATGNITAINGAIITTDVDIHDPGCNNQFENGKIELQKADNTSLGIMDVIANDTAPQSKVYLTAPAPADAVKFRNLDDDDVAHAVSAADMANAASMWASRYSPVCVLVNLTKTDLSSLNADSVNSNSVTYETNIGIDGTDADDRSKQRAKVKDNKQSTSSADFWVIYQLSAFQGRVDEDCDTSFEGVILGVSSVWSHPTDDTEAGTIIYRESTRDAVLSRIATSEADLWSLTSVHESGHEFGLDDGTTDGPMMDGSYISRTINQTEVDAAIFNGSGHRKIMIRSFPGR